MGQGAVKRERERERERERQLLTRGTERWKSVVFLKWETVAQCDLQPTLHFLFLQGTATPHAKQRGKMSLEYEYGAHARMEAD